MSEIITSNWKTSASAVVTALFGYVLFSPEDFQQWPWLIHLAKYAVTGGLITFGVFSKDAK